MRARYLMIGAVVGVLLSSAVVVLAGDWDPPSGPTDAASQMYTLEDIYNRLNNGTAGSKMTSFTEPASGPGTGMLHSLDDIMSIAPSADNTDGALPAAVLAGKTYWGLRTDGTWGPQMGSGASAPVAKTGQTGCYQSASPWGTCTCGTADCPPGQDGDLELGVPWGTPRFTDNDDGTLTDELTGLIWLKNPSCTVQGRTWAEALYDVVQLNADGTMNGNDCGDTSNGGSHQTDWRLPNIRELFSLVDHSQRDLVIPSELRNLVTGLVVGEFWSSTSFPDLPSYARTLRTTDGDVIFQGKEADWCLVWPVRGG